MTRKVTTVGVAAVIAALALAGCSGTAQPASTSSTGATDALGPDSLKSAGAATITWCAQKDSSGTFHAVMDAVNAAQGASGVQLNPDPPV